MVQLGRYRVEERIVWGGSANTIKGKSGTTTSQTPGGTTETRPVNITEMRCNFVANSA